MKPMNIRSRKGNFYHLSGQRAERKREWMVGKRGKSSDGKIFDITIALNHCFVFFILFDPRENNNFIDFLPAFSPPAIFSSQLILVELICAVQVSSSCLRPHTKIDLWGFKTNRRWKYVTINAPKRCHNLVTIDINPDDLKQVPPFYQTHDNSFTMCQFG